MTWTTIEEHKQILKRRAEARQRNATFKPRAKRVGRPKHTNRGVNRSDFVRGNVHV